MSDYFERVERQIVQRVEAGVPRSARRPGPSGYLAVAAAALVVIVVAGVFLVAGAGGGGNPAPAAHPALRLVFTASGAGTPAALDRTVRVLQERLHAVVPDAEVSRAGERIVVQAQSAPAGARGEILALAAPGRLAFYDWEGDAIAPDGKTVASRLGVSDSTALQISQGNGAMAPGAPGAGGVSMQQALALVAKLNPYGPRVVLLQAVDADPSHPTSRGAPNARFYVLRGVPALAGADVAGPRTSADPNTGAPDVTFNFTAAGRRAFERVTSSLARRGALLSAPGQTLNQHFAIAIDDRLVSVLHIDFKQYPDGITADHGAAIAGSFTEQTAKTLATLLRYGPLLVNLKATG